MIVTIITIIVTIITIKSIFFCWFFPPSARPLIKPELLKDLTRHMILCVAAGLVPAVGETQVAPVGGTVRWHRSVQRGADETMVL